MAIPSAPISGACHCGRVTITLPCLPVDLNACQCSHCMKRGALWAYYAKNAVRVAGETTTYLWGDREIAFHFCPVRGCTTHWTAVDATHDRVGVNARLLDPDLLRDVPRRKSRPDPR